MGTSCDFRQIYCTQNAITEADYAEHLLQKALPAHARAFRLFSILTFQNKNHFRSDFDFLNDVGRLRNYRDYSQSVDEFHVHPWNQRTLLRGLFRLRVSTSRLRQIVRDQLKTHAKPPEQPALHASSISVALTDTASTPAASTEGILSDQHKAQIKASLAKIASAPTPSTAPSAGSPQQTTSASGHGVAQQAVRQHEQGRTATIDPDQSLTAMAMEIDVLRVVNERLKCDLVRVTAQRDILKQAAAILAST